jgi:hypothetical protein
VTGTQIETTLVNKITNAYNQANAAYGQANTGSTSGADAYNQANAAYGQANTARDQANTARTQANTAYGQANNAYSSANLSYDQANASYNVANTKLASAGGTLSGDLIITGNLTVSGNSTTLNTEVLTVEDAEVVLLSNVASTPALNAGVIVNRGTSANTFLRWDEALDEWGWSDNGTTTYYFEDLRAGLATTNTTFGTINTSLGTINTSYQAAYAQANTARTTANDAYGQANAAYGAANNRVLKAGDTMTGQLNISSGGLLVTGNVGFGTTSPNNIFHVVKNSLANVNYNNQGAILFEVSELQMQLISDDGGSHATKLTLSTVVQANGTNKHWMLDHKGPSLGNRFDISYYTSNSSGNILAPSGVELLTILTDGKVGIGTTNPSAKMHVYTSGGGMEFVPGANGYIEFIDRANTSASVNTAFYTRQGFFAFHTGAYSERLRIINNGNVGIGTTNPTTNLQVVGDMRVGAASTGGSTAGNLYVAGNRLWRWIAGYSPDYGVGNGFGLYDDTGGAYRWMVDTSGNIGIGTTSPPEKLSVVGGIESRGLATDANYAAFLRGIYDSAHALQIGVKINSGTESEVFGVYADGGGVNPRVVINPSNGWKVGIANTNPQGALQVSTSSGYNLYLDKSGGASIQFARSGTLGYQIDDSSGTIRFLSSGSTPRVVIDSSGNVGIGTTSPGSYKLNVQGDQYISGTLTEASSVTLKENINPILNALDLITNLTGVTYDRKDGSAINRAGLIAEEVEQVLPNIIQKDKEGNPSGIQYTNLIAYLVESIKELKTEIDSLKKNNGKS